MDDTNLTNGDGPTINTTEQTDVPESFKTLCRMIMRQSVTYGEAWAMAKDIVAADNGTRYIPRHIMPSPFDMWC